MKILNLKQCSDGTDLELRYARAAKALKGLDKGIYLVKNRRDQMGYDEIELFAENIIHQFELRAGVFYYCRVDTNVADRNYNYIKVDNSVLEVNLHLAVQLRYLMGSDIIYFSDEVLDIETRELEEQVMHSFNILLLRYFVAGREVNYIENLSTAEDIKLFSDGDAVIKRR